MKSLPTINDDWIQRIEGRKYGIDRLLVMFERLDPLLAKYDGKQLSRHVENHLRKNLPDGLYVKLDKSYSWWELRVSGEPHLDENWTVSANLGYFSSGPFSIARFREMELGKVRNWAATAKRDADSIPALFETVRSLRFHLEEATRLIKQLNDGDGLNGSTRYSILTEGR